MDHMSPRRVRNARRPAPQDKATHKLPPQQCVLYLPDRRAYLARVNLLSAEFETVTTPLQALKLEDEQAEALGLDVQDVTGLRVALRPYHATVGA